MGDSYNDAGADVILRSDKGVEFRVHSYMLKAHSTVLRDMLDVPRPQTVAEPVQLDISTETLRRFLDLMYNQPRSQDRKFEEEVELLQVLDKWGSTGLNDKILANLSDTYVGGWDLFKIAAQHDNIGLAKLAIQLLDGEPQWAHMKIWDITADRAKDVPLRYLLGFLAGLARFDTKKVDYGRLSSFFQPASAS